MSKRLRTFSLIVISLFLSLKIYAQQKDSTKLVWEFGIDTYSLLIKKGEKAPYETGYNLIIKRKLSDNTALRFRPGFSFEYMPNPDVKNSNQPRSYDLSTDIGFEKQKRLKRFVHYYGADLRIKYINTNSTSGLGINDSTAKYTTQKGYTFGLGINPFMGGKFMITDRISIALETSCTLYYLKYDGSTQDVNINNQPIGPKINTSSTNGIVFGILPISALFLTYHF